MALWAPDLSTRRLPRFLDESAWLSDPCVSLRTGGRPPELAARPLLIDPVERVGQLWKVAGR